MANIKRGRINNVGYIWLEICSVVGLRIVNLYLQEWTLKQMKWTKPNFAIKINNPDCAIEISNPDWFSLLFSVTQINSEVYLKLDLNCFLPHSLQIDM